MGSSRAWLHLPHPFAPPKQLKHFNRAADIWRKLGAGISCFCRAFGEAAVLDATRRGLPNQIKRRPMAPNRITAGRLAHGVAGAHRTPTPANRDTGWRTDTPPATSQTQRSSPQTQRSASTSVALGVVLGALVLAAVALARGRVQSGGNRKQEKRYRERTCI